MILSKKNMRVNSKKKRVIQIKGIKSGKNGFAALKQANPGAFVFF